MDLISNQKKVKIESYLLPPAITSVSLVLILLIKHNTQMMPIPTMIKMAFMSVTMYFYFNHCKMYSGTSYAFKVLFSIMYAFNGYVLLYALGFPSWMDFVVAFPVLMLSYNALVVKGKKTFYSVMVAISFIISDELGQMALFFIFVITGALILTLKFEDDGSESIWDAMAVRGRLVGNMLLGTIMGIGGAAFTLIPRILEESDTTLLGYWENALNMPTILMTKPQYTSVYIFQHFMMIYGLTFAIAIILVGLIKYRKEKRNTHFVIGCIVFLMLALLSYNVEELWNLKVHEGYSVHFGFIISFSLLSSACYYAGKPIKKGDLKLEVKFEPLERLLYVLMGVVACTILAYTYNKLSLRNVSDALAFFGIISLVLFAINIALLFYDKGHFNVKSTFITVAVEIFIGTYALFEDSLFYDFNVSPHINYVQRLYEASIWNLGLFSSRLGWMVTGISIILFVIIYFIMKKKRIYASPFICEIVGFLYMGIWVMFMVAVFFIPAAVEVIKWFV